MPTRSTATVLVAGLTDSACPWVKAANRAAAPRAPVVKAIKKKAVTKEAVTQPAPKTLMQLYKKQPIRVVRDALVGKIVKTPSGKDYIEFLVKSIDDRFSNNIKDWNFNVENLDEEAASATEQVLSKGRVLAPDSNDRTYSGDWFLRSVLM